MIAPALTTTCTAGGPRLDAQPRLTCKIASNLAERRQACRLVYQSYLAKGLIEPNQFGMRVTPWHLLPTTSMFAALEAGRVIGTVKLIGDVGLDLPMESIHAAEVARGRAVCRRSLVPGDRRRGVQAIPADLSLTRLMAQHARAHGMHQFLNAIHPKHARFYEKFTGFEQIGNLTEYRSFNNAPTVACYPRLRAHQPPSAGLLGTVLRLAAACGGPGADPDERRGAGLFRTDDGTRGAPVAGVRGADGFRRERRGTR